MLQHICRAMSICVVVQCCSTGLCVNMFERSEFTHVVVHVVVGMF